MNEKIAQAVHDAIKKWADGRTETPVIEFKDVEIPERDLAFSVSRLSHEPVDIVAYATRYMWFRDRSVVIDCVNFHLRLAQRANDGAISAIPTQVPMRINTKTDRRLWKAYAEQVTRDYPPPDTRGELAGRLLAMIEECDEMEPGLHFPYRILDFAEQLERNLAIGIFLSS